MCAAAHARRPNNTRNAPQVEWLAPRPLWEFVTQWSIPKNQGKWASRLKCNTYYYRTNYLLLLGASLLAALLRQPLALLAALLGLVALLVFNDPFASSLK
jgi:hypothetical protein